MLLSTTYHSMVKSNGDGMFRNVDHRYDVQHFYDYPQDFLRHLIDISIGIGTHHAAIYNNDLPY